MMAGVSAETIDGFVRGCHEVARRGLVRCSSGNLSMRVTDDRLLVTATRSWLERITANDLALCRIADGLPIDGAKPTVEIGFHAGILNARREMNVVLHFQTPCATTLACMASRDVNFFVIPEIPFYVGPIGHVPFLAPGSPELARSVIDVMRDRDLAIMQNHGQVTVARDMDHAIQNAEFFELACEIILRAGERIRPLSGEAVRALLDARESAIARV